ncbi:MAG: hypothetical protein QM482_03430 [Sulfurospirillum sp.]
MEKLRDIKGIVEVQDYSMYYLLGYIFLAILLFVAIFYLLTRPRKRKKPSRKEMALKALKTIDYSNPKDLAYIFTLNIPFFIVPQNEKEIESLLEKLRIYKYKKYIPRMDEELKNSIKKIIGGLK